MARASSGVPSVPPLETCRIASSAAEPLGIAVAPVPSLTAWYSTADSLLPSAAVAEWMVSLPRTTSSVPLGIIFAFDWAVGSALGRAEAGWTPFPVALNSMALMSRTSKWWAMPLSSLKVIVWDDPSRYVPLYRVPSRRVTVSLQPGIVNARTLRMAVRLIFRIGQPPTSNCAIPEPAIAWPETHRQESANLRADAGS